MTSCSTAAVTRSRICSEGLRTGDVSTPAKIGARASSCLPSPSPPLSSIGSDQRVLSLDGGICFNFDVVRTLMAGRSEEHTSELQSLMRISYAVFCLKKKTKINNTQH